MNKYQEMILERTPNEEKSYAFMMLELMGSVGRFSSEIAKNIKAGKLHVGDEMSPNDLYFASFKEWNPIENSLVSLAGEVLSRLAGTCKMIGIDLDGPAMVSLMELNAKKEETK